MFIYSIKENKIIDSTYGEGENRIGSGFFTLFDNDNRIIFTNGIIMYIINLENIELELTSGVFYIGKKIIYLEKKDVFLGRSDFNITRLGYDRNTEVENDIEQTDIIYPNPSDGSVKIKFTLDRADNMQVSIFDNSGNEIQLLHNGLGEKEIELIWDTTPFPSGIYYCRIAGHYFNQTSKIIVIK